MDGSSGGGSSGKTDGAAGGLRPSGELAERPGRAGARSGTLGTKLEGIRQKVFLDRYSLKDRDGRPLEQYPEQVWERVARGIAAVEATPAERERWCAEFYSLMDGFRFVPGGRILAGAGTGHAVTYFNCYVLPSPEDSRGGILDNLKLMTEVMARGGGVGLNLSTLRPRGSYIRTVNGTASGPCSWAELYSVATGDVIQQGGSRRGALMLMLNDDHPDVEEFITVKKDHRRITSANLSVCVSDALMEAVKRDADWKLVWNGEVRKVVKARYLWDLICQAAWESGEPGVVFLDRYNKLSNTWYYEQIISVNPCVTGDTLVATATGYARARDLQVGMAIRTPAGLKPIAKVYNNGVQRIYHITFSDGGHLDCTADHKLKVVRDKKYEWVATRDLKTGDRVLVAADETFGGRQRPLDEARQRTAERDLSLSRSYAGVSPSQFGRAGRLGDVLEDWHYLGGSWTASVVGVEDTGREEEVFDVYEPETLTWVTNGYVSLDCGEQGLPAFGVCNLGALNLASFVEDGALDYAALARYSRLATRFLDNVVDANEYFLEENRQAQLSTRRTGLGTMGLADALIKLRVRYGSPASLEIIDRVYRTIRDAAYAASAELAAEKGPFPRFDPEKYLQGAFICRLPAELQEQIRRQGIRNAVVLTQAPTGTTSLLAGVSSGIEPVYDFVLRRRDRTGEHILYHPLYGAWREAHPGEPVPDYFVSASELTPEEHVRVQAKVQEYTDSSISKCVTGDTLLFTDEGLRRLDEFYRGEQPDTFRPLSLRLAGEHGEATSDQFYFGGVRPVRRVTLKTGISLTGTPNHRIKVYDQQSKRVAWKCLADVQPGDEVPLVVNAQVFGNRYGWSEVYGRPFTYERGPNHKVLRLPTKLTADLARWLGYLIADGNIGENSVRLSQTRNEVVDDFVAIGRLRFGIEATVSPDPRRENLVSVSINSQELVAFLRYLGLQTGAAHKSVPLCIRAAGREIQEQFVRGLTLDGYVSALNRRVILTSVSETLCREVQTMLLNLGIVCRLSSKPIEYEYKGAEPHTASYEVSVVPRFAPLFEERIGYAEKRKARELPDSYDRFDALPVGLVEGVLSELSASKREHLPRGIHNIGSGRLLRSLMGEQHERLTRHYLQDRLVLFSELRDTEAYQTLWRLATDGTFFDPVEEVADGQSPVYDLSVPDAHAFVGNGIVNHNTVNAPNSHTVDDVRRLYSLAYELGCKGITYFRDGSREGVLTHMPEGSGGAGGKEPGKEPKPEGRAVSEGASVGKQDEPAKPAREPSRPARPERAPAQLRPRPHALSGKTYRVKTPVGTAFVTINDDEQGSPFEVFITVGKAGSDIAADAEALGRLISLALRIPSDFSTRSVAEAVVNQLSGIGGSNSLGFGAQRVRSVADAVAKVLAEHLGIAAGNGPGNGNGPGIGNGNGGNGPTAQPANGALPPERAKLTGDFCPSCGQLALVYEEGCRKCYVCGFSNC